MSNDLVMKKVNDLLVEIGYNCQELVNSGYVTPATKPFDLVLAVTAAMRMQNELEAKLGTLYGDKDEPSVSDKPVVDNVIKFTPKLVSEPNPLKDS